MSFIKSKIADKAGETFALPRHIGIIMDGNGRWAVKRGLPRSAGHAAGSETFRRVATYCRDIGIEYLTVYAFSTENWKRSQEEVGAIMGLLEKYLLEALQKMEADRVKIRFFGDLTPLSPRLRELADKAERTSDKYDGIQLNICLNYGGRAELTQAVRSIATDCASGKIDAEDITEELISSRLWSAGVPDPDLIIRPSGELRLSNFLMWQSAYSELYFTDTLWPDFDSAEIDRAVSEYGRRSRRYGGV